jgi:hypothetical protein
MRVKALEKVFYNGRDREIGEEFDTLDDLHGRVLMVSGRVIESPPVVSTDTKSERRGPRYRRRDMRADE